MRAIFGVLGLVLGLGIVGWLAKTQLALTWQAVPSLAAPGADSTTVPSQRAGSVRARAIAANPAADQAIGRRRNAAGPL